MFAELYLTDGTTKIDLLGANRNGVGIALTSMRLSRPQREPSGAFRQVYGAVNESYELKITDRGHDAVAQRQQQLDRMLEQAANYFTSNVEDGLVWLCARTADESNPRYALIYGGMIESYDDVYGQPFVGNTGMATMNEIALVIERSTWQANPPDAPECVALTNAVEYNPNLTTWSSNRSITNVQSLFTTSAGSVLAGSNLIDRTADSGGTWATEATTGTANLRFWMFAQAISGRIWAAAGLTTGSAGSTSGIYYSDNDGDTWTQHTASVDFYSVVYRSSDDTLFFGGDGEIRYIQNSGSLSVLSTLPTGKVKAMALSAENTIVAGDEYNVWYVPNNQLSLYVSAADDVGAFLHLVTVGDYLLLTTASYISISRDDGQTFAIYWREWGTDALYMLDNGALVASKSGTTSTYISYDGGFAWVALATMAAQPVRAFTELGDTYLFAAANNAVYRRIATDANITYGPYDVDCTTPVYVANHRLESNWTHIFVYDSSGSSYTAVTPTNVADNLENSSDQLMFPSPVGTNDAFYIGIQSTAPNPGAFSNFYVHLTEFNYTLTLAVEYYNGSAWTALTTATMRDTTQSLHRSGTIAWHLPDTAAMTAVAINSVTAYWIRIRVTATGTLSTLLPKFDNIYIVQQPFIELDNLAGDVPAIAQIKLFNRLDVGADPLLSQPTARVIAGLRSVERGERFTAYLNLAQAQNPPGITVTDSGESAFVTNATIAAAGQFIRYTPVSTNIWGDHAWVTLDSDLAKDFAGTYQIYLRYAFYGADDTISVRLAVESFSFGLQVVGDEVPIVFEIIETDYARLAHLGQFTIAPDRYLSSTDAGEQTRLVIQLKATTTADDVDLFELILIPADEWIGEFYDAGLSSGATAGASDYVDIDSATFPKRILRSMTRQNGSDLVTSVWQSSASGAFVLQPGQQQRLWFLCESYNAEEVYTPSPHTLLHQVRLWHHARWLGLRGED